jgi:hypothetical protein
MTHKPCAVKVKDPVIPSEGHNAVSHAYFPALTPFLLFNGTQFHTVYACTGYTVISSQHINVATSNYKLLMYLKDLLLKRADEAC